MRANFTVFRCPSIGHGRASERLSIHVSEYVLFAFVRSKSLVIACFAVRMGIEYEIQLEVFAVVRSMLAFLLFFVGVATSLTTTRASCY